MYSIVYASALILVSGDFLLCGFSPIVFITVLYFPGSTGISFKNLVAFFHEIFGLEAYVFLTKDFLNILLIIIICEILSEHYLSLTCAK